MPPSKRGRRIISVDYNNLLKHDFPTYLVHFWSKIIDFRRNAVNSFKSGCVSLKILPPVLYELKNRMPKDQTKSSRKVIDFHRKWSFLSKRTASYSVHMRIIIIIYNHNMIL